MRRDKFVWQGQGASPVALAHCIGRVDPLEQHRAVGVLLPAVGQLHPVGKQLKPSRHSGVGWVNSGKGRLRHRPSLQERRPLVTEVGPHHFGEQQLKPAVSRFRMPMRRRHAQPPAGSLPVGQ